MQFFFPGLRRVRIQGVEFLVLDGVLCRCLAESEIYIGEFRSFPTG